MKKIVSLIAVFTLCLGLLALTGCGEDQKKAEPFSQYDLTEYITLPDYDKYETSVPDVKITDDQISFPGFHLRLSRML